MCDPPLLPIKINKYLCIILCVTGLLIKDGKLDTIFLLESKPSLIEANTHKILKRQSIRSDKRKLKFYNILSSSDMCIPALLKVEFKT